MVTRRAMLKGTAAGSIAAIASAHGVAASAAPPGSSPIPIPYPNGLGAGYGNLEGGALGSFVKLRDSYGFFLKWHYGGAEVFYKERTDSSGQPAVDVFAKFFDKARGWGAFQKVETFEESSLQGAAAGFQKVEFDSATISIFLKVDGELEQITRDVYANVDVCEPGSVGCEGTVD